MVQPGLSCVGANLEAGMGFAQAQPPSVLSLLVVSAEKLNKKGCELFGGTPQALARKERAKNWIFRNTRVKRCRQPPATLFTTECVQQCTASAHGTDCTVRHLLGN